MTEQVAQLLCRKCGFVKGLDDISVNYGMASDGNSAGGLCRTCAAKIAEVKMPESVSTWLKDKGIEPDAHTYGNRSYEGYEG